MPDRPYAHLRVLINEDRAADAELLEHEVEKVVREPEFRRVQTREAFGDALTAFRPDLVISDYFLPTFDGLSALKMAHAQDRERPFILVSGLLGEQIAIDTMKEGATDYVLKDRLLRLAPAVERALREVDSRRQRKAMQGQLDQREQLLDSIFEEAPVGIAVVATDGKLMLSNKCYDDQLGCERGTLVGRSVFDFTHPDDVPASRAQMEQAASGAVLYYSAERRYIRCNGSYMWAELSATVLLDAEQRPKYVLTMVLDTSERRRLLDVVVRQERLRALGQMASAIAHDINNALSPVIGYAEMLATQEPGLSDRAQRYLRTITTAAGDIARIVGRMKEFYQARVIGVAPAQLEPNALLEEAIEMTAPRSGTDARHRGVSIEIVREFAPALPWLNGTATDIREALVNLVFNAVDALPKGGRVTLRSMLRGGAVVLEVEDTGLGMDATTRARCLEPFYTTKGAGGTGLGLSSVAAVIRAHGGEIEIDSKPGAGTTVRLVFPLPILRQVPVALPPKVAP